MWWFVLSTSWRSHNNSWNVFLFQKFASCLWMLCEKCNICSLFECHVCKVLLWWKVLYFKIMLGVLSFLTWWRPWQNGRIVDCFFKKNCQLLVNVCGIAIFPVGMLCFKCYNRNVCIFRVRFMFCPCQPDGDCNMTVRMLCICFKKFASWWMFVKLLSYQF